MDLSFTQIKETCLYIRDLDQAEAFYHGKLGLPLISKVKGRHIFFRAGKSVLLCFIPEATRVETRLPPHFGEGQLHMAFECEADQYEAWKAHVSGTGIEIIHEEHWPYGGKSFYFHDPEMNVLEVVQPGIWGD